MLSLLLAFAPAVAQLPDQPLEDTLLADLNALTQTGVIDSPDWLVASEDGLLCGFETLSGGPSVPWYSEAADEVFPLFADVPVDALEDGVALENGKRVFLAAEPGLDLEPYALDTTTFEWTRLRQGPNPVAPRALVSDGLRAFFTATTTSAGRELWTTDGSASGTQLVS